MDWLLVLGGLGVGTVVGLTGMGGGALMTPMLVIFFGVDPVTAVSSDLVVSLVMKPFGAGVHAKEGTVNYSSGQMALPRLGAGGVRGRARS